MSEGRIPHLRIVEVVDTINPDHVDRDFHHSIGPRLSKSRRDVDVPRRQIVIQDQRGICRIPLSSSGTPSSGTLGSGSRRWPSCSSCS